LASPAEDLTAVEAPPPPARPVRRIVRSFRFAFAGLRVLVRGQPNVWVHLALAALALALAVLLHLSPAELAIVILTIGLVLTAEAVNTALESACDTISPTYHPLIRQAKDVAAAAVLLAALTALGVALALFLPALLRR
jgi:diacylglycerol kinase